MTITRKGSLSPDKTLAAQRRGTPNLNLRTLRSDCVVVVTQQMGDIMFGAPPEIVKDFMRRGRPIPSTVVLGNHFVNNKGILYELEFPFYANRYISNKRFRIIGSPSMLERARVILTESYFGPENVSEGSAQRKYFRDTTRLEDHIDFISLDKAVDLGGVKIRQVGSGIFSVIENGKSLAVVDTHSLRPQREAPVAPKRSFFDPPAFGVTFIGTSNGFDPHNRTTSLILWINGKGIFIDPLVNPDFELGRYGINRGRIEYFFLTHCHSDHDVGIISCILARKKIKLITSRAIYESFVKKAEAMIGFHVRDYIEFIEAIPGKSMEIMGGKIEISSALHSIPTINLRAEYQDAGRLYRLAYSADALYAPAEMQRMFEQGILSAEEMNQQRQFVESGDYDLLVQEAGVVRPHTKPETLGELSSQLKEKIRVVHVAEKSVDAALGLKLPRLGETVELVPSELSYGKMLGALKANPIFCALPLALAARLIQTSTKVFLSAGEKINRTAAEGKILLVAEGKFSIGAGKFISRGEQQSAMTTDLEALSDGLILLFDKKALREMAEEIPAFAPLWEKIKQL